MPNDVKAILSAVVLIVAAVLAYWSGSPVRHDFSTFVMVVAVLMVAAMWVFPEAARQKGRREAGRINGSSCERRVCRDSGLQTSGNG